MLFWTLIISKVSYEGRRDKTQTRKRVNTAGEGGASQSHDAFPLTRSLKGRIFGDVVLGQFRTRPSSMVTEGDAATPLGYDRSREAVLRDFLTLKREKLSMST